MTLGRRVEKEDEKGVLVLPGKEYGVGGLDSILFGVREGPCRGVRGRERAELLSSRSLSEKNIRMNK